MYKLLCSDEDFLYGLLDNLKNGENLERALFFSVYIPAEVKFELQIGKSFEKTISMVQFSHSIILNLLMSLVFNTSEEAIKRIKITADIIRKQNELRREKANLVKIHQRRIKIIRLISTLVIAILAGFSPITISFYSLINTINNRPNVDYLSPLSFSFFLVNIFNSYFLLTLSGEKKRTLKLAATALVHILLVIIIGIMLQHILSFL